MERFLRILKKEMNPELVNVCYESHLKQKLFRYKKRRHYNSWVYHPETYAKSYIGSVGEGHREPTSPLSDNTSHIVSSNYLFPGERGLNEDIANASPHAIPIEVSTVHEDFPTDEFTETCKLSPNLAGVYFAVDCQKCDMPEINTSGERCRMLLTEHPCDVHMSDIDPRKIHPQWILNLFCQALHAVYVLHSCGFIHGCINKDSLFFNYVDYGALNPDEGSAEKLLIFGYDESCAETDNGMCKPYTEVYAMNNVAYCGVSKKTGSGGIQVILGGYNNIRKVNSSFCRINDDVASLILSFSEIFGSNFIHLFNAEDFDPEQMYSDEDKTLLKEPQWTCAPLFDFIDKRDLTKVVTDHISLVARNVPNKDKNYEELIEANIKAKPWLSMFTCPSKALYHLCNPCFRRVYRNEKLEAKNEMKKSGIPAKNQEAPWLEKNYCQKLPKRVCDSINQIMNEYYGMEEKLKDFFEARLKNFEDTYKIEISRDDFSQLVNEGFDSDKFLGLFSPKGETDEISSEKIKIIKRNLMETLGCDKFFIEYTHKDEKDEEKDEGEGEGEEE
jgi:hypothetical protein